jgi:NADH:ubiquinone oxidoreductase subunit F (NADH-binding)
MEPRRHYLIPDRPYRSYQDYLSQAGPLPLEKFRGKGCAAFLEELSRSGLRGRGGAGFPTGRKWQTIFEHPCKTRYVVCNAAEGEPGTFKDRFLLRKNPYAVLEGILIACRVLQAKEAYIGAKASFVKELESLKQALSQLQKSYPRECPVHLVEGPEEYLFGEEKALLNVIENEGPFPRTPDEPPYEVGLFATPGSPNPALVNNVQTFAHVASIARHGGDSFRELGTPNTPGTLLFTLCGEVARPGVYEAEAGISVQRLLEEHGGGPRRGRRWKALLPGVSAPALSAARFKVAADFDAMQKAGSSLGAAGFIVLDDSVAIPAVAQAVTRFLYVESCNQCSACKAGLRVASQLLDEWRNHPPDKLKFVEIQEAAERAPQGNRCYLPVQGARLVPSLLQRFKKEFSAKKPYPDWALPKIVDFDEASHTFSYDEKQRFKQPDWTYRDEASIFNA